MPDSPLSKDDWCARLKPLLHESLDEVSERITSHPSIQSWIHTATFEAAQDMGGMPGMQAEARAYGRMIDELNATFPALIDAVDELTHGCGQLDLHWRPLEPNYSRIYIQFAPSFDVDLCYPLDAVTRENVADAVESVRNALPQGAPFPNRPNRVTGLVVHEGSWAAVRYIERVAESGQRRRRVTLVAPDREPLEGLERQQAIDALYRYFQVDA